VVEVGLQLGASFGIPSGVVCCCGAGRVSKKRLLAPGAAMQWLRRGNRQRGSGSSAGSGSTMHSGRTKNLLKRTASLFLEGIWIPQVTGAARKIRSGLAPRGRAKGAYRGADAGGGGGARARGAGLWSIYTGPSPDPGQGQPAVGRWGWGWGSIRPATSHELLELRRRNRQDFVAEAGAPRKAVGPWELVVGT
jgi:hypothetical protein